MNVIKFSEAISQVDTRYVEEALRYQRTGRKRYGLRLGIAACLCAAFILIRIGNPSVDLLLGPGLFSISAYALSPDSENALPEECQMQEGVQLSEGYGWNPLMSSSPGLPLKLSMVDTENAAFDISTDSGRFLGCESGVVTDLGSEFRAENNTTVYWTSMEEENANAADPLKDAPDKAYVAVVVRDKIHIIGYAVLKIELQGTEHQPVQNYYALLLKSVSYPKIDGRYQAVSEAYVSAEIEQVKRTQ